MQRGVVGKIGREHRSAEGMEEFKCVNSSGKGGGRGWERDGGSQGGKDKWRTGHRGIRQKRREGMGGAPGDPGEPIPPCIPPIPGGDPGGPMPPIPPIMPGPPIPPIIPPWPIMVLE